MEAEGPDPALALCGQKSTFTFLPGEASREAGPQPRVAPGGRPPTSCLGPTVGSYCRVGAQKRDGKWKSPSDGSLRWGEVGGNPSP